MVKIEIYNLIDNIVLNTNDVVINSRFSKNIRCIIRFGTVKNEKVITSNYSPPTKSHISSIHWSIQTGLNLI